MNPRKHKLGSTQQKILLLLAAGVAMGFSCSPRQYFRVARFVGKEWARINRENLWRSIRALYAAKLVGEKVNPDGSVSLILSKNGEREVLRFNLEKMKIAKIPHWDKKWRIVTFDIPEELKGARDAFRFHLKRIGMKEHQKSVFISPYPCEKEIEFLVEFYNARSYVRILRADSIDNDIHFRQLFDLGQPGSKLA